MYQSCKHSTRTPDLCVRASLTGLTHHHRCVQKLIFNKDARGVGSSGGVSSQGGAGESERFQPPPGGDEEPFIDSILSFVRWSNHQRQKGVR